PPLPEARRQPPARHRRRHARHVGQRHLAGWLHVLVPLRPPRVGRARRRLLAGEDAVPGLALLPPAQRAAPGLRLALAIQRRIDRSLYPARCDGSDPGPEDRLFIWPRQHTRPTSTTSSSSAPAVPACGRPSRPPPRVRRSAWCASRCWAKPTPSWPRAASPPPWATCGPRTTGRSTSATPCAAARCSTTGAWRSCTRRRRPPGCSIWSLTA